MEKILRSQIHEVFSKEIRVQLELISRRRDIRNEEKQEEIIKLLQSNNIGNFVKLGPGTNRYALKLNGYVFKFATDNDGKIDNFKEFKMAKRLFPYVTKTYEVSENGTILVAEYIQPFTSYAEMLKYADKIREILRKLSDGGFLIGDVGISSINYSNWGLRIGSDEPVCLDFAYVYEVNSSIFLCKNPKCRSGSMLVPNKDFTLLSCPVCQEKKEFSDLRGLISYEMHAKEIGDLSDEGYLMTRSKVKTELDLERSNYLAKMKPKKEKKDKIVEEEPQTNILGNNIQYKEETNMNIQDILANTKVFATNIAGGETNGGLTITPNGPVAKPYTGPVTIAGHRIPEPKPENGATIANDTAMPVVKETGEGAQIAFSGKMDPNPVKHYPYQTPLPAQEEVSTPTMPAVHATESYDDKHDDHTHAVNFDKKWDDDAIIEFVKMYEEHGAEAAAKHFNIQISTAAKYYKRWKDVYREEQVQEEDDKPVFSDSFKANAYNAVSKFANRVYWDMRDRSFFDQVKPYVSDKNMYPDTFYKSLRRAISYSLCIFMGWQEVHNVPNKDGSGTHMEYEPVGELGGSTSDPTLIFIKNLWENRDIEKATNLQQITDIYADAYDDSWGVQNEWLPVFRERLMRKLGSISAPGIQIIINDIQYNWCSEAAPDISGSYQIEGSMAKEEEVDPEVEFEEDLLDEENENEEPGEDDGEDLMDGVNYVSITVFMSDPYSDVINITTSDQYCEVSIPIYTKIDEIDLSEMQESIVDPLNDIWDWLIHFAPDVIFKTQNPQKWIDSNECIDGEPRTRYVILDKEDDWYTIGIYYVEGIWLANDDGTFTQILNVDTLAKINKVITQSIGFSAISHLQRTLAMESLVRTEEYIESMTIEEDYDDGTEEEGGAEEMTEAATDMSEIIEATEQALMVEEEPEPDDEEVETVEVEETVETSGPEDREHTRKRTAEDREREVENEYGMTKSELDELPPIRGVRKKAGGTMNGKGASTEADDDVMTPIRRPRRGIN